MKYKFLSLLLAVALLTMCLSGCGETVGKIAGNVADAAMKELETQVKKTLEENKLEVVEIKTVFGVLNDEGSEHQFFCAALVKSEAQSIPQATADTLSKLFTDAGLLTQTTSKVDSPYLVHKDITFKHSDFSDGTYYVIFAYQSDLTANMPTIGS